MIKFSAKTLISVLILSIFFPLASAQAAGATYRYRLSEMGTGTRQTGQWEYEITGKKYDFSTNESVFAMTRIFQITNITKFQFKYQLDGAMDREQLSPVYKPNKNWWAEIWYWDEFGRLPAGDYTLNIYISVDGGSWKKLDNKFFSVSGANNYDYSYEYDNVQSGKCGKTSYTFDSMAFGKNVRNDGSNAYSVVERRDTFRSNENVFVLVKNTHLTGMETFRIKFDVYKKDGSYFKTEEAGTQYPACGLWAYNYAWANLGTLPVGDYEVRSSIKVNSGSYRVLDSKRINVNSAYAPTNTVKEEKRDIKYSYSWTQTDNTIRVDGNYRYSTVNPRDKFGSNEEVKVLTKLSDIKNVSSFRVRHELHKDGKLVDKFESADRKPNASGWEYNFTESNFGRLSAGSYEIRVFVNFNNEGWRFMEAKTITVTGGVVNNDYGYDWTMVGNNKDFNNYGFYNLAYPSYVNFPFSVSHY